MITCSETEEQDFNERFTDEEKLYLQISNVPYEFANSFPDNFDYNDIIIFYGNGIDVGKTKEYPEFLGYEIALIEKVREHFPDADYKKYLHKDRNKEGSYGGRWALLMFASGEFSQTDVTIGDCIRSSLRYKNGLVIKQFHEMDLMYLSGNYVNPNIGLDDLTAFEMGVLSRTGFIPNYLSQRDFKYPDFDKIRNENNFMRRIIKYIGIESSPDQFKLLGTGREGIVWLKENQVLKFSLNGSNEIELLKKIMNCNNGRLKNVINITGHIKNPENDLDILVLEYVKGQSLLNIISKQNIFYQKASDAMKIGKDLLNGLKEVRRADIYHRDIKPANILIEYGTNRAILMDLGISTENSIETINGNKGYGGNNDLISIGQVIYETYTGKNLFNDKPTFLCQTLTKDNIVTERTKAYDDPKKLKEIFEKVSDNIPGTLGKLIVQLLDDDLWTQPNLEKVNKLYEIFEKFTEEQLLFDF